MSEQRRNTVTADKNTNKIPIKKITSSDSYFGDGKKGLHNGSSTPQNSTTGFTFT